jgi:hypothetical protein
MRTDRDQVTHWDVLEWSAPIEVHYPFADVGRWTSHFRRMFRPVTDRRALVKGDGSVASNRKISPYSYSPVKRDQKRRGQNFLNEGVINFTTNTQEATTIITRAN